MQIRKDKNNIIILSFIDKFYFIKYNFCGELLHLNIKCLFNKSSEKWLPTFYILWYNFKVLFLVYLMQFEVNT